MKDAIESLPEYFICKKDPTHHIKYQNGVLLLGDEEYRNTNEDEKYIMWAILTNAYSNPRRIPPKENYTKIYNEWIMYGKSSSLFFKTFSTLINKYSKNRKSKKEHKKLIQQLQDDVNRKKRQNCAT